MTAPQKPGRKRTAEEKQARLDNHYGYCTLSPDHDGPCAGRDLPGHSRPPLIVRLMPCWLMTPYWYESFMGRFGYERTVVGYGYAGGSYGEVLRVRRYGWRKIKTAPPTCATCGVELPHERAGCWR